ncbi:hypothetical protein EGD47_26775 [Salmonella enterica]|nr:hypothetical protein [Salmonella enterica]
MEPLTAARIPVTDGGSDRGKKTGDLRRQILHCELWTFIPHHLSYQRREKTGNGYLSGPDYKTGHGSQMSATARCQDNFADNEDASEHISII